MRQIRRVPFCCICAVPLGRFSSLADILIDEKLDAGLNELVPVPILDSGGKPIGVFALGIIAHILKMLTVAEFNMLCIRKVVVREGKVGEDAGVLIV